MIEIRDEKASDAEGVYRVVSAAFGRRSEADLVEELRRAGDCVVTLVAEEDGEIAGHVLLSRMEAPFQALALAPVSVAPARQRCGIGSALIRSAVERARKDGWEAIFVLGEPGYYGRFGFDAAAAAGFTSPYAGEHFMVLALGAALPVKSGELKHARAFGGKR
ncbi:MAG TPA: N-acetyltransferase [Candidatus Acidoferrales bacterium]|nr:N-acetyltransferase [Candidatus Acidoferrales bacterium]